MYSHCDYLFMGQCLSHRSERLLRMNFTVPPSSLPFWSLLFSFGPRCHHRCRLRMDTEDVQWLHHRIGGSVTRDAINERGGRWGEGAVCVILGHWEWGLLWCFYGVHWKLEGLADVESDNVNRGQGNTGGGGGRRIEGVFGFENTVLIRSGKGGFPPIAHRRPSSRSSSSLLPFHGSSWEFE